jgi:hypothetical protein
VGGFCENSHQVLLLSRWRIEVKAKLSECFNRHNARKREKPFQNVFPPSAPVVKVVVALKCFALCSSTTRNGFSVFNFSFSARFGLLLCLFKSSRFSRYASVGWLQLEWKTFSGRKALDAGEPLLSLNLDVGSQQKLSAVNGKQNQIRSEKKQIEFNAILHLPRFFCVPRNCNPDRKSGAHGE